MSKITVDIAPFNEWGGRYEPGRLSLRAKPVDPLLSTAAFQAAQLIYGKVSPRVAYHLELVKITWKDTGSKEEQWYTRWTVFTIVVREPMGDKTFEVILNCVSDRNVMLGKSFMSWRSVARMNSENWQLEPEEIATQLVKGLSRALNDHQAYLQVMANTLGEWRDILEPAEPITSA